MARLEDRLVTPGGPTLAPARRAGGPARALLRAARPRQWPKNVLVLAVPTAAGDLGRSAVLGRSVVAAGLFLAASAGIYLVNDAIDAPQDRLHPEKSSRPVASGELPVGLALAVGAMLLAASIGLAAAYSSASLAGVVGAYVVISLSYTFWLKQVPVVELACVASGFVLRAVAGGAAVHLPVSPWFLAVASSGALLIVAGKRSAELATLQERSGAHRRVLDAYSDTYLRFVRTVAATLAVTSYGLWAFSRASQLDVGRSDTDDLVFRLSVVPFVIAVLVLELALQHGEGGAPERLALSSRPLQLLGAIFLGLVLVGIYT
ncbi:MAG: UbiA family prenyltransferase [Acidimicrobiaceae bacterium]|nr:UbiA family prenyltransferase [Acidimicrobiaceae bacterium]